ncbi:tyrosine-protein phosphatase non-receptor type 22-like isoform X1 [Bombina bombina]|uniref:tyrosine-protein phosphatase non-receptor type 22-like isoform X1 n=1 Tax=Bombina bombina TaxID=8345 RepID=UPI00235A82DF|nr:tyrosine-protein phosphatase non-receptor type 22-like isoform X1 [Bombina bombina]
MEQREVLQRYVEGYQKKKEKSEEFAKDFLSLKRQSAKYKSDYNYSTKAAERPENIKKNRYKDILPFDHCRVELSLITSDEDTDFINASFIKGVYCPRAYIATQGPLPNTVTDFWRMIWEYNTGVIVMACMEFEMGKKKCERYWAELGPEALQFGPFIITCKYEEKKTDYVIRTLHATYGNETRIVHQLHYKNWPDHDVPSSVDHILDLIKDMHFFQQDDNIPICIHCSAGCGRTGVICVIDYIWRLLKDGIIPMNFSIYYIIQEMRTQRASLVQTKEQYELVYNAVIHLFKKELGRCAQSTANNDTEVVPAVHQQTSETESNFFSVPRGLSDKDSVLQQQCLKSNTEETFQSIMSNSAATCNPGVTSFNMIKPSSSSDSHDAFGSTNLSSAIPQPLDPIRIWDDRPCPLPRTLPQKYQLMDTKSVTSSDWHPSQQAADRKGNSEHPQLIRTKSSPFELLQKRHSHIPERALEMQFLGSKKFLNDESQVHKQLFPWQNTGSLGNISTVPSSQSYVRMTEDPYFTPSPASDLESQKIVDFLMDYKPLLVPKNSLEMSSTLSSIPCHTNKSSGLLLVSGSELTNSNSQNGKESIAPDKNSEAPPPLPERTPESFIVPYEAAESPQDSVKLQPPSMNLRIGTSLEWSGVPQCANDDFKHMMRSKSVKVRSSRLEKSRNRSSSPPPLPERTEDSFIIAEEWTNMENHNPAKDSPSQLMDAESIESMTSSETEKLMTRKKSLKMLRNVKKNICSPAKQSESSQSSNALSFLNFNFGKRFAKPKGPRNPPASWNL